MSMDKIRQLKKEYLALVKKYRRLGYSHPESLARGPKMRAYAILIERCGMKLMEAVEFFRKVEV